MTMGAILKVNALKFLKLKVESIHFDIIAHAKALSRKE
jgi:hypothetical protein